MEKSGKIVAILNDGAPVIRVLLNCSSACSNCRVENSCGKEEHKIIDVRSVNKNYRVGDQVSVCMSESKGFWAIFLVYIIPLFFLVIFLFLFSKLINNELLATFWAISSMIVYYFLLYLFRKKIDRVFKFDLK